MPPPTAERGFYASSTNPPHDTAPIADAHRKVLAPPDRAFSFELAQRRRRFPRPDAPRPTQEPLPHLARTRQFDEQSAEGRQGHIRNGRVPARATQRYL